MTVWGMGALYYSDVATVFLRGLPAIVFGLRGYGHALGEGISGRAADDHGG
jgi:hypothetical protein